MPMRTCIATLIHSRARMHKASHHARPLQHSADCSECPMGEYQHKTGQSDCEECPVGKFADKMGCKICKDCSVWEYSDKPRSQTCKSCFAMATLFGFALPAQCSVIWIILGLLAGLIGLFVSVKFCDACSSCCATIITICKDKDTGGGGHSTFIIGDNCSSEEENDMPPMVPEIEMQTIKRTTTLNIMGDDSETDDDIIFDDE